MGQAAKVIEEMMEAGYMFIRIMEYMGGSVKMLFKKVKVYPHQAIKP